MIKATWLGSEECSKIVTDSWTSLRRSRGIQCVEDNLSVCSAGLRRWYSEKNCSLRRDLKEKKAKLQHISQDIRSGSWEAMRIVEQELDGLLNQEEVFWQQRSRVDWLRSGDTNPKFFNSWASGRRVRNKIHGLFDGDGCCREDKVDLERIVSDYFQSIFSSSRPTSGSIEYAVQCLHSQLSHSNVRALDAVFLEEEVRCAFFQMGPFKAPGKDVFPAIFF
ncbi:hypothetical protein ACOSQ3_009557 [Xanthoceras sorbifolium]